MRQSSLWGAEWAQEDMQLVYRDLGGHIVGISSWGGQWIRVEKQQENTESFDQGWHKVPVLRAEPVAAALESQGITRVQASRLHPE